MSINIKAQEIVDIVINAIMEDDGEIDPSYRSYVIAVNQVKEYLSGRGE